MTSAFELETPTAAPRPLILQMDRGDGARRRARSRMERALLEAARPAGVPVPEVVACGDAATSLGASWLVVERLEGETIPRKILRDAEWAARPPRPDRPVRARRWRPSTPSTRTRSTGLAAGRPAGRPAALPRRARRGAARARARRALAGAPTARRRGRG